MNYNCEYVVYNKWVEVEDLKTLERWFCLVSPDLTEELLEKYRNPIDELKSIKEGIVWVHTPLGGSIIGRMVGDEFGFYENGVLNRCRVKRIIS